METIKDAWYYINNISAIDSPALVVYPERVKKNISRLLSMVPDPQRLRPHCKTHKNKEATQLMMEAGITKFKCATIAEAEMLALCKAPDVLLSYQPPGPKLQRFIELVKNYPATRFSCLVDNNGSANEMSAAFSKNNITIEVYIDLNLGQNRTGIKPGEEAIQLYTHCAQLPGIAIKGLHAYDGHIRNSDITARTNACNEAYRPVEQMRDALVKKQYPEPIIIAGGSPTFPIHAKRETGECSPGTFIFWDKGYSDLCPEQPFLPAAILVTRVISLPAPGLICLDLGHKSVAAENELNKRVFFPDVPGAKAISQSEEHLVLDVGPGHSFKTGDVLYGIPMHICPTVALYERAFTVENGNVTGEWKIIARDRRINI